jgi:hypothetical protein
VAERRFERERREPDIAVLIVERALLVAAKERAAIQRAPLETLYAREARADVPGARTGLQMRILLAVD